MLTSRKRVMAAVNQRKPDRTPVDRGGHRSSGVMAIADNKLKQHPGIPTGDIYVCDFVRQLAIVEPELLDRLGVDTVELGRGFALKPERGSRGGSRTGRRANFPPILKGLARATTGASTSATAPCWRFKRRTAATLDRCTAGGAAEATCAMASAGPRPKR